MRKNDFFTHAHARRTTSCHAKGTNTGLEHGLEREAVVLVLQAYSPREDDLRGEMDSGEEDGEGEGEDAGDVGDLG